MSITLLSLIAVMLADGLGLDAERAVGIPLLVVPLIVLVQGYHPHHTLKSRDAAARLSTRLDEIFHGIQTIKLNRLERSEDDRFERELKAFLRPAMRAQVGQAANPALMDLIAAAGFVAVLWFGGQQIIEGDKSLGEFMSFFTALGLMFEPLAAPVQHRRAGAGGSRLSGTHLRSRSTRPPTYRCGRRMPKPMADGRHPVPGRAFRL
jgi:subfamily B ATP-binding cassette protein MsbA